MSTNEDIMEKLDGFILGDMKKAMDEITRLRAENDDLKKKLDFAIKGVEKYEAIIDAAKEQAKDDLSKKLREANGYLFRDWKENARLMWQAAEEIEKLDDNRIEYIGMINKLVDERAKLRKALLAVYDNSLGLDPDKMTDDIEWVTAEIRAAREALEDK